jgi:hypothetical protein
MIIPLGAVSFAAMPRVAAIMMKAPLVARSAVLRVIMRSAPTLRRYQI